MTLDGQMTEIDLEEKQCSLGTKGLSQWALCFEAIYRNAAQQAAQNLHNDLGSGLIDTGVYQVLYDEAPREGPSV